jgi:hypothetical protein
MAELPEDAIESAEFKPVDHTHDGLSDDADRLRAHLGSEHDLDAPAHLSTSTLLGLHDRLHHQTGAADH